MGTKDAIGEDVSLPINSLTPDNKILGVAIRGRMLERRGWKISSFVRVYHFDMTQSRFWMIRRNYVDIIAERKFQYLLFVYEFLNLITNIYIYINFIECSNVVIASYVFFENS